MHLRRSVVFNLVETPIDNVHLSTIVVSIKEPRLVYPRFNQVGFCFYRFVNNSHSGWARDPSLARRTKESHYCLECGTSTRGRACVPKKEGRSCALVDDARRSRDECPAGWARYFRTRKYGARDCSQFPRGIEWRRESKSIKEESRDEEEVIATCSSGIMIPPSHAGSLARATPRRTMHLPRT